MRYPFQFLMFLIFAGFLSSIQINAQCVISNLQVETDNCVDNDHYSFTFNFFISESPGESFDVFVNGAYHSTHNLNERPLTINGFQGNPSGQDTLMVCASGSEDCCASKIMINPCPCTYFNIEWTTVDCTEDSLWFELDFEHINAQDSFHVGSVGNYLGFYHVMDLPIVLGPIARATLPKEVLISSPDFFCFEYFELSDVFCESCLIHQVNAIAGTCNEEGFFPISVEFLHRKTGGNGFTILGNGTNYGSFAYSTEETAENGMYIQTVELGHLPGDCETVWEFIVRDNEDTECSDFTSLQPICCSNDDCNISNLTVSELECTSVETIRFVLDFEYSNAGNENFDLYLNDSHSGFYALSELPLLIEELQFYPNAENVLRVCINDQPNCCNTYTFENLDCFGEYCELGEIEHMVIFIDQEVFYVQLNFDHNNTGSEGFTIMGNGKNYGTFSYENLPVLIGPFNCKDGTDIEFGIKDVDYPECSTSLELGVVPCETGTVDQSLSRIFMHYSNDKNVLTINDSENTLSEPQFRIYNTLGQLIPFTQASSASYGYHLNPEQIQPGVYFVQVMDKGKYRTFKFIFAN